MGYDTDTADRDAWLDTAGYGTCRLAYSTSPRYANPGHRCHRYAHPGAADPQPDA